MTKITYSDDYSTNKIIKKLDETSLLLQNITKLGNKRTTPPGYRGTKYIDTIKKVKKADERLANIRDSFEKVKKNLETAEINSKKRSASFDCDFKIAPDKTIIEIK